MAKKNSLIITAIIVLMAIIPVVYSADLPPGLIMLQEYEQQLGMSITFLIAFLAGIVSFTSPCGFAVLPTYFSFAFKDKRKSLAMTTAFSVGMLLAFVLFGLVAGLVGDFLNIYKVDFAGFSGYAIIFFGILLLLNKGFSIFNMKINSYNKNTFFGMMLFGFVFGTAWTPCVGPVLVGIIILAANSSSAIAGTLSLFFYGLGVIVPLLLVSYLSDRYNWSEKKLFRGKVFSFNIFGKQIDIHSYNLIGGLILILVGISIVLYKGTFFFQTTLVEYIPWSMGLWGYLNEKMVESEILKSALGNILGIFILILVIALVYAAFIKQRNDDNSKNNHKGENDSK